MSIVTNVTLGSQKPIQVSITTRIFRGFWLKKLIALRLGGYNKSKNAMKAHHMI